MTALEAVRADFADAASRADARVVDENVDPGAFAAHVFREFADLRQRGEVGREEKRAASALGDPLRHSLAAGAAAAMHDDARPVRTEALCNVAPDPVGRAGD